MLRVPGSWEHDVALLNVPAQDRLHVGLAVLPAEVAEDGVLDEAPVPVPDGVPGLHHGPVGLQLLLELVLLVERMALDLDDRGRDVAVGKDVIQTRAVEIAEPDAADLALLDGGLHSLVGGHVVPDLLVQEEEVHTAHVQALQHPVDGVGRLPVLRGPELAGDPDLVAGDAGCPHRPPHAALVAVGVRGVDVTVAAVQCCDACVLGGLALGYREDTETHLGYLVAVVESDVCLFHRIPPNGMSFHPDVLFKIPIKTAYNR